MPRLLRPEAQPAVPLEPSRPGVVETPSTTPSLPVGIPQFAAVKDRVASGLKPLLDGLEWLRGNGYRTVLHIKQPGEDDSADRRLIEKNGLVYLSLEVSPLILNRAVVDQFNRIVSDPANLPLFVYDKDGIVAGGLWYLHFRIVERASDEAARARAGRLGFREDAGADYKTMLLAVQQFLRQNPQ